MNRVSWQGRSFRIELDLTSGTGFDGLPVYKTDNLTVEPIGFKVDDKGEPLCGAPGIKTFEGAVSNDKEAMLILKLARPWEGDGSFNTYVITSKNGSIANIEKSEQSLYGDFTFEDNLQQEGMFRLYLPKDWEAAEITDKRRIGLAVKPDGKDGCLEIFHSTHYRAVRFWQKAKKVLLTDKEYTVVMNGNNFACLYGNDIYCVFKDAGWQKEHLPDIIRILDTVRYEKDDE